MKTSFVFPVPTAGKKRKEYSQDFSFFRTHTKTHMDCVSGQANTHWHTFIVLLLILRHRRLCTKRLYTYEGTKKSRLKSENRSIFVCYVKFMMKCLRIFYRCFTISWPCDLNGPWSEHFRLPIQKTPRQSHCRWKWIVGIFSGSTKMPIKHDLLSRRINSDSKAFYLWLKLRYAHKPLRVEQKSESICSDRKIGQNHNGRETFGRQLYFINERCRVWRKMVSPITRIQGSRNWNGKSEKGNFSVCGFMREKSFSNSISPIYGHPDNGVAIWL